MASPTRHRALRLAVLLLATAGLVAGQVRATPPGLPPAETREPKPPEPGSKGEGTEGEDEDKEKDEAPGPFDALFNATNPGRLQQFIDRALGLDAGDRTDRPRRPEFGEPVFFDFTRPLGDFKYGNELNYLLNSSTRNAPTLQVIEYEYTFADWRSAEIDLSYYNGDLQLLTPFYQRTLGVGPRRNWAHGYQVSLDLYLRSGFVGGSPVYVFAWKPEEDSKFSTTFFVGANRALIGGFDLPRPGLAAPSSVFAPPTSRSPEDRPFGAWRPVGNADFFYKLGETLTLGLENDLFFHAGKAGEYLVLPFLTYDAGEHAFFQAGAGYYRFESKDQLTFFLHLNFVNPSPRKPRVQD